MGELRNMGGGGRERLTRFGGLLQVKTYRETQQLRASDHRARSGSCLS